MDSVQNRKSVGTKEAASRNSIKQYQRNGGMIGKYSTEAVVERNEYSNIRRVKQIMRIV